MRVEKLMDLDRLMELMGQETTQAEAKLMRTFLVDEEYHDTDDVPESDWIDMVRDAVQMCADDGGPTGTDMRGEVQHG